MTDPTTNEQIALELGWTHCEFGYGWLDEYGIFSPSCPDYEHDWAHAGPLLEEMPDDAVVQISRYDLEGERKFQCKLTRGSNMLGTGYGKTRKAALSRAWLAWKEEE